MKATHALFGGAFFAAALVLGGLYYIYSKNPGSATCGFWDRLKGQC